MEAIIPTSGSIQDIVTLHAIKIMNNTKDPQEPLYKLSKVHSDIVTNRNYFHWIFQLHICVNLESGFSI